ncbi:ATP-binding protein [Streptomyces sp. ME02-8801-2C]|uniref:ATP-binding protein n=1 Tax=Streptomyces sp. ME02-8801-2C TaxID=3028680 RepID=UPI0029A2E8F6|nr:ATP-binding protein [Streptomyces sp. ME02-8801-2C]MDX3455597.1 ATP-binding protein [Streptomyces sp. ME02-8801-2C]
MQVLQVQLEIRPDPAEVGRARRWARSWLAGSGVADDDPLAETLILLVSELVTNAVVHTGCPAVLRLSFRKVFGAQSGGPPRARIVADGVVRLEVADLSARPPAPRHAEGDDTNGRGLELVDGLADRWGWNPEGVGKRIWCELDRCPAATPCGDRGDGADSAAATAPAAPASTAAAPSTATAPGPSTATSTSTASAYGGMAAYEAV